jgi:hypothetical protein
VNRRIVGLGPTRGASPQLDRVVRLADDVSGRMPSAPISLARPCSVGSGPRATSTCSLSPRDGRRRRRRGVSSTACGRPRGGRCRGAAGAGSRSRPHGRSNPPLRRPRHRAGGRRCP